MNQSSAPDLCLPRRSLSERGLTLVEVSLVSVVLVVMSAIIVQSLRSLSTTQSFMSLQTKISSLTERIATAIETDVTYSMHVFGENGDARDYLARLDLAGRTPLADSRLPVGTSRGVFDVDPSDAVETGNLLFLGRKMGHELIDASADATPDLLRVDVLRFVVWFLEHGPQTGVDLSRWSGQPMARLQDVEAIEDLDRRARLATGLYARGVRYTWDPGAPAASALRTISSTGEITALPAVDLVDGDVTQTEVQIFGTRHVGIAANSSVPIDVPAYARATTTFPHGFEIKRDGDGTGGLMLIRLVGATPTGARRQVAAAEAVRQIAFRQE